MCEMLGYEINYNSKCSICHRKGAVDMKDPETKEILGKHEFLCEKHGIEVFGSNIVEEWAGTELYLKKCPDEKEVWK